MATLPQAGEYIWVLSKVIKNEGIDFTLRPVLNEKGMGVVLENNTIVEAGIELTNLPDELKNINN